MTVQTLLNAFYRITLKLKMVFIFSLNGYTGSSIMMVQKLLLIATKIDYPVTF